MDALDALTLSFSKLPGIGRKSARRIAFSLLKTDDRFNALLASQIIELKEKIRRRGFSSSPDFEPVEKQ